jgi:hypothetical protein
MTYIVPEIALATRGDIVGILDLQEQNLLGRGGLLSYGFQGRSLRPRSTICRRSWRAGMAR